MGAGGEGQPRPEPGSGNLEHWAITALRPPVPAKAVVLQRPFVAAGHHELALIAREDSILSVYEGTSKP
jgi:hypothetical protein